MSTDNGAEPTHPQGSKTEALETAASGIQLQRMDPDSILADEANPEGVFGKESPAESAAKHGADPNEDDDASALKRASAASAIFSQGHPDDHNSSPRADLKTISVDSKPHVVQPADQEVSIEALKAQVKDLTNQVTGLNEKLVKSFNRIADLEDDYSDAQEQIWTMSARIKELEKERAEHLDALNTGLLVEKAHVSSEMQRMMDRVIDETAQRGKAESDKSKIEAELDELSSSLFSEANKMVAVERLSRARAEEKSRNMEERLKDTEGIMLEQQKVLADLQRQVENLQIGSDSKKIGDDGASIASKESEAVSFHRIKTSSLVRSISQRTAMQERKHKPNANLSAEARLIINIVPYQEFRSFIAHLRKLRRQLAPFYNYPLPGPRDSHSGTPTPRTASPALPQSAGGISPLNTSSAAYSQGLGGTYSSSSSPFAVAGLSRHRDFPSLPSNVENLVSLPSQLSLPFIKRSQEEDVEPCLRLDFAPGLNWLSRRQANTAILDGNLVIEPIFSGSTTIDEDAIRRENAHLPPAACAMCGIPVINVPLPGGVAATALSAEQGGKTSLVPSSIANATSSWASSAASSLGSITGSSSGSSSGTLTPRPSSRGLFSSFRRSASSTKPVEPEPIAEPAPSAAEAEANSELPRVSLPPKQLPVPTHIFRINESGTTRYLLCPHHCLLRLRAVCQFWGFVRNLERSVVLEGKFMPDEQIVTGAASSSSLELPKVGVAPKSEQVETLEKAVEEAEEKEAGSAIPESDENAESRGAIDKTEPATAEEGEKTEAEKIKESVLEESAESDDVAASDEVEAVEAKVEAEAEATEKGKAAEGEAAEEDEKKPAAEDDDFADAPSSPTAEKAALAEEKEEQKKEEEAVEEGAKEVEAKDAQDIQEEAKEDETKEDTSAEPAAEASTETTESAADVAAPEKPSEAAPTSTTDTAPLPPAPRLPPRSAARGPVIPPRRHVSTDQGQIKPLPRAPTPAPVPTALYLANLDTMEWEDKMWTEVTKLKEELWRARIGLITED